MPNGEFKVPKLEENVFEPTPQLVLSYVRNARRDCLPKLAKRKRLSVDHCSQRKAEGRNIKRRWKYASIGRHDATHCLNLISHRQKRRLHELMLKHCIRFDGHGTRIDDEENERCD